MAADRALAGQLEPLARSARIVLVTGLPGTGKSLLIHQLAHLAADASRVIHLLQWDVARPVFEASPAGRRYPMVDGATHAVVRKAVGLWARRALLEWQRRCAAPRHALIGEAPLVGNRLIELARRMDDATEPVLAAASCRFVIAVPSAAVRGFLEAERERRAARPLHPREREDAPPAVLKALWRELVGVAQALGIPVDAGGGEPPYEPLVYQRVYEALLRHRRADVVALQTVLPTSTFSVYELAVPRVDLLPREEEADAAVREAEALHPDAPALAHDVARWWVV